MFADVAEQIETGWCIGGGCTVHLPSDRLPVKLLAGVWTCLSLAFRWAAGSFVFCEAAAFRQIGGFDETLYASEEIDLSRRLKRLAWETGREMVILTRHPLVTSPRKLHLYTDAEHLRLLAKVLFSGGRVLTDRKTCALWYDGRR